MDKVTIYPSQEKRTLPLIDHRQRRNFPLKNINMQTHKQTNNNSGILVCENSRHKHIFHWIKFSSKGQEHQECKCEAVHKTGPENCTAHKFIHSFISVQP